MSVRAGCFMFLLASLLIATFANAGDELQLPVVTADSGYKSESPKYELIGIEHRPTMLRLWVVAEPSSVLRQRPVNMIIADIRKRLGLEPPSALPWEIFFYSRVRDAPQYPAFRVTELLATYASDQNRTRFLDPEGTYGGWAYGPPAGAAPADAPAAPSATSGAPPAASPFTQ